MKNKQVKQMICDIRDSRESHFSFLGHHFKSNGLNECIIDGCGPDDFWVVSKIVKQYVVSLTADQLRGSNDTR